jgi:hypothetical protein
MSSQSHFVRLQYQLVVLSSKPLLTEAVEAKAPLTHNG